jgi:hypothetical protein
LLLAVGISNFLDALAIGAESIIEAGEHRIVGERAGGGVGAVMHEVVEASHLVVVEVRDHTIGLSLEVKVAEQIVLVARILLLRGRERNVVALFNCGF